MSRKIQPIQIDGQTIWVEIEDIEIQTGKVATSPNDSRFSNTANSGQSALEAIEKVDLSSTLSTVIGQVKQALESYQPDEVKVELTLGFKAEIGVFVASGEANAQIKISAKWSH